MARHCSVHRTSEGVMSIPCFSRSNNFPPMNKASHHAIAYWENEEVDAVTLLEHVARWIQETPFFVMKKGCSWRREQVRHVDKALESNAIRNCATSHSTAQEIIPVKRTNRSFENRTKTYLLRSRASANLWAERVYSVRAARVCVAWIMHFGTSEKLWKGSKPDVYIRENEVERYSLELQI